MTSLLDAALVRVGGPTNVRSVGGSEPATPPRALADVAGDLGSARQSGARLAVLVGGEPTVRPDLPQLVGLVARADLALGLATNGRMLVYPKLRALLLAARPAYVRVALHGPTAAVHDPLVRVAGAFEQTMAGLRALLAEGPRDLRVDVACTVVADNAEHLGALVETLLSAPRAASLSLRFVAPLDGLAEDEWPAAEAIARCVPAALDRAAALASDVGLAWEGFAPCLLEGHAHLRDEILRYAAPAFGPEEAGRALPRETGEARSRPLPCQDCLHEATCPGAPAALLAREGGNVLRPTRAVRANSFNFEHERDLPGFVVREGACPARELILEGDPVRHLLLERDDAVALYRSPTADFTDEGIRRARDDLEQVYLDVNPTAALTDFTDGVRRVRLHPECRGCADRPRCATARVVDPAPPFAREERWLRMEVSRLRGRVLDVGCGEQPYRDEIARGIAEKRIEYHGLDPDAAALERFRTAGVGGTLHLGTIEEFDGEAGWFDYVLAFRSLNHFRDIERAFSVIQRVMRPQGLLYLCDSVVFAMLRTREQVAYADAHAAVGHEHFRNWSSHQVVKLLERFRFRLDVHRPVGPQTSNQWLLKFMRVADAADNPVPAP